MPRPTPKLLRVIPWGRGGGQFHGRASQDIVRECQAIWPEPALVKGNLLLHIIHLKAQECQQTPSLPASPAVPCMGSPHTGKAAPSSPDPRPPDPRLEEPRCHPSLEV